MRVSSADQDDWNGTQRTATGKAPPPSRGAKTTYREHPYRQYWSGLAALSVSAWLAPVDHGSSRFKQPDKSNCSFCLCFIYYFSPSTGLYTREQIGTENWTCFFFFFDIFRFLFPSFLPSFPSSFAQLTGLPSLQLKRLSGGFEGAMLASLLSSFYLIPPPAFFSPFKKKKSLIPSHILWLLRLFCIVDRAFLFFKCFGNSHF